MESILPLILNAGGGAVIGPILSKMLGGSGSKGLLGGIVGGLAGGYGLGEFAGGGFAQLLNGSDIMAYLASFLNGGVGGGILGGILGKVMGGSNG